MFGNDYRVDENYNTQMFEEGEWEAAIIKAEESTSKAHNEMIVLSLEIENQGTLKYYLVDDKSSEEAWVRTNRNLTRFFDCFNIQRGDFKTQGWIGKKGIIKIGLGKPNAEGKQFFEVKQLIVQTPPQNQHNPTGRTYGQNNGSHYSQGNSQAQERQRAPSAYVPKGSQEGIENAPSLTADNGLDTISF